MRGASGKTGASGNAPAGASGKNSASGKTRPQVRLHYHMGKMQGYPASTHAPAGAINPRVRRWGSSTARADTLPHQQHSSSPDDMAGGRRIQRQPWCRWWWWWWGARWSLALGVRTPMREAESMLLQAAAATPNQQHAQSCNHTCIASCTLHHAQHACTLQLHTNTRTMQHTHTHTHSMPKVAKASRTTPALQAAPHHLHHASSLHTATCTLKLATSTTCNTHTHTRTSMHIATCTLKLAPTCTTCNTHTHTCVNPAKKRNDAGPTNAMLRSSTFMHASSGQQTQFRHQPNRSAAKHTHK